MKTKTLLFLFLLISGMMFAQEVKRVAILETVDKENQIDYAYELLLRGNLSDAITSISGYEAYDRTDIDAIMSEQSFQRTGLVSNDQIKRLGEMTGANYILVAEIAKSGQQIIILSKLLDVETARTIMSDHEITTLNNIQDACKNLAKRMFHEEVKVEPKVETNFELIRHTAQEQKLLGIEKYSYGTTQMDEKAFRLFMQKNNREAYLKYMKSQQMIYAGWGLLGGGMVMTATGIIMFVDYDPFSGGLLLGFGSAAIAISVPLLSVGYPSHKKAFNMFNEQNSKQQTPITLNLQASQNGVGLALNF
ncbi:MAG: hypothetical protein IKW35_00085 [Paludibacteraceae bacterium]|nr:hypothetical protein [Paludibacteraceae bacterium]